MNNMSYYGNPEMAPFDAAFNDRISRLSASGTVPGPILNQIVADWQNQKINLIPYHTAKYRNVGGINATIVNNIVERFIECGIKGHMGYSNTAPMYGMPMGAMATNAYVNQNPFAGGGNMYATNNMFNGNNNMYGAMAGTGGTQNQYADNVANYASFNNIQSTQQNDTEAKKENSEQNNVLNILTKSNYQEPVHGDADELYGTEEHVTCLGTVKVIPMVSGSGCTFNHVTIKLNRNCLNDEEALMYAKRIYNCKNRPIHMDICYDKLHTINVPYEDCKTVFNELKKSIPTSSKSQNKLRYLQNIQKVLDAQNRGVADGIEDWLIDQFLEYGRFGCADSDNLTGLKVNSIDQLIKLSSKDTVDENCIAWQKIKGFIENLTTMCDLTIKHIISKGKVLNPGNLAELDIILRNHIGLMETSNGDLIDVVAALNDKLGDYSKATPKERLDLFGEAGAMIANTTTIIVPCNHLVYTNLMHDGMLGYKDGATVAVTKDLIVGGVDDNGNANSCDTDFEYMITRVSFSEDIGHVIVGYDKYTSTKYSVTRSTDHWHRINKL